MAAGSLGQPINSLIPVRMAQTDLTQLRHPVELRHLPPLRVSHLISRFFLFLPNPPKLRLSPSESYTDINNAARAVSLLFLSSLSCHRHVVC